MTIEQNVVAKFAHARADEYYGITVEGTLMADGGDSTTAIPAFAAIFQFAQALFRGV